MSRFKPSPLLPRILLLLLCSAAPTGSAHGQGAVANDETRASQDRPAAVVVIERDTGGMVRVTIRLPAGESNSRVASYQGEITLAADRMTLGRVVFPSGVLGSWHQPSPGRLRFAGAAPVPAEGHLVLVVYVRALQAVRPGDVTVALEELTMTTGN